MASIADHVAAIDHFMATPKTIIGADTQPQWQPGRNRHERIVLYPLEVEGELRGSTLMVVAFPRSRELMFRLSILFAAAICRIDFTDEFHPNTLAAPSEGLPLFVNGPHYHSWPINRRFFRGMTHAPELHNAVEFDAGAHTFDAVLRWFCADTRIEPLLPDHRIELPASDQLL